MMELGAFVKEVVTTLTSVELGGKAPVQLAFDLAVSPGAAGKVDVVTGQPSATPLRLSFTVPIAMGGAGAAPKK
jgi:hypothetical protein